MRNSKMGATAAGVAAVTLIAMLGAALNDNMAAPPSRGVPVAQTAQDPVKTKQAARLEAIPGLIGTVVATGQDQRFEHAVDLVIETQADMDIHNQQFEEHPEWFEDINIGVAYVGDVQEQLAQAKEMDPGVRIPAPCETDLAESPGVRWVRCTGSGDAAAYAIPAPVPAGSREEAMQSALERVGQPVDQSWSALGYANPAQGLPPMAVTVEIVGGAARVDLRPDGGDAAVFAADFSDVVGYVNALLVTTLDYQDQTQFTLDGSCEDFSAWASTGGCVLGRSHVQPRGDTR